MADVMRGVHHVGISVADLDRSLAFWKGFLGIEPRERRVLAGQQLDALVSYDNVRIEVCWIDLPGGVALELTEYLAPRDAPYEPGTAHPGNVHVCLEVDDAERALAHAWECGGVRVSLEPMVVAGGPRAGARIAYVDDPDGVTIELFQPPPGPGGG